MRRIGIFKSFQPFQTYFSTLSYTTHFLDSLSFTLPLSLQPMAPSTTVSNGTLPSVPVTGRLASVYSEVQKTRVDHALPLPNVLKHSFTIVDGPPSSAAGNPGNSLSLSASLILDLSFSTHVRACVQCR